MSLSRVPLFSSAVALFCLIAACSSGSSTVVPGGAATDADAGADGATTPSTPPFVCTPDITKARGPTQSCCPDFGVDACGPTLVCAALDGRTVPVCYPAQSRAYGETCNVDAICLTKHCSLDQKRCDGGPGCPPCGFTATCTVETYYSEKPQPGAPPDETTTRVVEAKPNGPSNSCYLKSPPAGRFGDMSVTLECVTEKQNETWRVELDGTKRILVHDKLRSIGSSSGSTVYQLDRTKCPLAN